MPIGKKNIAPLHNTMGLWSGHMTLYLEEQGWAVSNKLKFLSRIIMNKILKSLCGLVKKWKGDYVGREHITL